ncbi:MAG: hypothetical protein H6606_05900 [Flavobacteriales bacterium]|nr:hypothetical protein [Flavobacteriales bacterium]
MYELYNHSVAIEANLLYEQLRVTTFNTVKKYIHSGKLRRLRRACKNTPALLEFYSLPEDWQNLIMSEYGDPLQTAKQHDFESRIHVDVEAAEFFSNYRLPDNRNLPHDVQIEYCINAQIYNAITAFTTNLKARRRSLGGSSGFNLWEIVSERVNGLNKKRYPHSLPTNPRSIQRRYNAYKKQGYQALVHKNYCNNNSRKVDENLERLILSLYCLPNKPYSKSVADLYGEFIAAKLEVFDASTGELFDPADFYNNGVPVTLSESTVWNYINDPANRALVDSYRSGKLEFNNTHRPHHHRHAPIYSMSKISLDDRDLPRKMKDGSRVKAYYAYDVASGAVVGASYSHRKNAELFIGCLRDMFRNLENWEMGTPLEVEVEHHLVESFKDDLFKAGTVFPFVRWANPGNAQEKRAEHFNRAKKYGFEKRYQNGIGRFYSKLEANRPVIEKIASEDNDQWKEERFHFEELVADDRFIIEQYNNALHPNQKLYPGMTRLQVLLENSNPTMAKLDKGLLARYIGERVYTSIRRNQYLQVQYEKYQIPSLDVMDKLSPNNKEVAAYYIPTGGQIEQVYIYQEDTYLGCCNRIVEYNESTAEATPQDRENYSQQAATVAQFDSFIKEGRKKISKLGVMPQTAPAEMPVDEELIHVPRTAEEPQEEEPYFTQIDWLKKANDEL